MGAHENQRGLLPIRASCEDFSGQSNALSFTHISTKGSSLTQTNGRSGVRRINIQLDIAMCTLWINTFWVIWFCRNQIRFQNNYPFFQGVQSMVSANVSLTGNHSKGCMAHSMSKFSLLKTFAMDIHPPKPFIVKRVDWFPHLLRVSIG